ncbi:MAG: alpha-ribazole phosphatase [Tannerella sp.]|jgi:alpha-ribazole phosphatase|nr:alpha-ribazole phosphatase [Tannerella sp.]
MEVYLIRHTSVDVLQGVCYGQTDVPLKPSFEQEAEIVKGNLAAYTFDAVYTSPLTRCVKLATYCGYPDARQDDRLKELFMGDWEMLPFDEIKDPQLQEWYDNFLSVPTRNGESFRDLRARVSSFLKELANSAGRNHQIAVFTHGGVLLSAQLYAGISRPENAMQKLPSYGEIIKISI